MRVFETYIADSFANSFLLDIVETEFVQNGPFFRSAHKRYTITRCFIYSSILHLALFV